MKAKIKPCKKENFISDMNNLRRSYPRCINTYDAFVYHILSGVFELTGEIDSSGKTYQTTFRFIDDCSKQMWINKEFLIIKKE